MGLPFQTPQVCFGRDGSLPAQFGFLGVSACNVFGQVGLLLWFNLGGGKCLSSDDEDGGACHRLTAAG